MPPPTHMLRVRAQPLQQLPHRGFCHRNAPGGRWKVFARQMQEYRAAAAGNARRTVVIDLDNKIIEVIVALEPIAAAIAIQPHWLVVMAAPGVFAPGVFGSDSANRQKCTRSRVAV